MPAIQTTPGKQSRLRTGAALMALAGLAFVGYAAVFLVLNFTDAFLELGIGPDQVDKGKAEVEAFSPQLYHYISHLHIALGGFIAATGLAVAVLAHYPWGLATLGHLGPVYLAVLIFLAGVAAAYSGMRRTA